MYSCSLYELVNRSINYVNASKEYIVKDLLGKIGEFLKKTQHGYSLSTPGKLWSVVE